MDVFFVQQGLRFVWDSEKAKNNLAKHDVRFEKACEIFFDPMLLLTDASVKHAQDERRQAAIGVTSDLVTLFVVHLLRDDESIRIISARPATKQEKKSYEDDE